MRLGAILPSFAADADEAIEAACSCERAGLHGVFCYDHLWPLGEPGRPAISPYPLLGALCRHTTTITLGTLVSRVGLVPDGVLISELLTLDHLSGGRLIASLGTGDHKSEAENRAFGLSFPHAALRREELFRVASVLRADDVTVWVGAGAKETNAEARRCGATLNVWSASVDDVKRQATDGPVSWAGRLPADEKKAGEQLAALCEAGATWAVSIWPGSVEPLVEAARNGGVALGQ